MEILITGGAGFIGSHILEALQGRPDVKVVVFDNLSGGSREHVPAGMELIEGISVIGKGWIPYSEIIPLRLSSIWRPRRWFRSL